MSSIQSLNVQLSDQLFTAMGNSPYMQSQGMVKTVSQANLTNSELQMKERGQYFQKGTQINLSRGSARSSLIGSEKSFYPEGGKYPWPAQPFNLYLGIKYRGRNRIIVTKPLVQRTMNHQSRVHSGSVMMFSGDRENINQMAIRNMNSLRQPMIFHPFSSKSRRSIQTPQMNLFRFNRDRSVTKINQQSKTAYKVEIMEPQSKPLISNDNHMDSEHFDKAKQQVSQEFTGHQASMLHKGIQFAVAAATVYSFILYAEPAFSADLATSNGQIQQTFSGFSGATTAQSMSNNIYGFDGIRDNMGVQDVAPELDLVETVQPKPIDNWLFFKFYGSLILFLSQFLLVPIWFNKPMNRNQDENEFNALN